MPYENISQLPDSIKDVLPEHAQEIYMKAFNNAYKEYENPKRRRHGLSTSREEIAYRVAWSAVKEEYEKDNVGNWIRK